MTLENPIVAIAVPLEAEHVESIRAAHPAVTVLYEPELLPPERFPADHTGDPSFTRTPEQEERYWSMVHRAQAPGIGVGGHISTYAGAATLYEVGFNHFFRGKDHPGGGDQVFFQGHASPGMLRPGRPDSGAIHARGWAWM